jgi:hypothetical protein
MTPAASTETSNPRTSAFPDTPKVIAFGIAKAVDTTREHTVAGQILGTVAYMSPIRFK